MSNIANFLITEDWDHALSLAILLPVCLYVYGIGALWGRAGVGHGVTRTQVGFFGAGAILLLLALASPLHSLGEMLFSAHMVQHLLITVVAIPLLVLGAPVIAFAWSLPPPLRRPLAQWWNRQTFLPIVASACSHPLCIGSLFGAVLWLWHIPLLYEAALQDELWHALEHSTFLTAALFFWWVVRPTGQLNAQRRGQAMLLLIITAMHSGLLGALITFAPTPWYESYRQTTLAWALMPLADQQLAGVLMWWPMGLVFGGALLWHLAIWLHTSEEKLQIGFSREQPNETTFSYSLSHVARSIGEK